MPTFTDINEVKKYINVSNNLDIKLLLPYEDTALRKVYEFIPKTEFSIIQTNHSEIYEQIKKAVANYMVAFAIPFIKIHLTNTGGNNFDDNKLKKADWWDIRDYGLSAVRIADEALTVAINELLKTPIKSNLTLHAGSSNVFATPNDFSNIYNIGNSWDVLTKLNSTILYVWRVYIERRIKNCAIDDLLANSTTKELLQGIVAYYTIAEAVSDPSLLFTTSGIVLQWEELPWQKSKVLDTKHLTLLKKDYTIKANELFNLLFDYLKENLTDFPCYEWSYKIPTRKTIAKKSGLYL